MRVNTLVAALVLGSGILASGTLLVPAFAQTHRGIDASGANGEAPRPTLHEVQLKLDAMGYRDLTKISRERDALKIRATDSQNRRVDIHVDPVSGAVFDTEIRRSRSGPTETDRASWLTMHQVQVKLEAIGYRDIEEIARERNCYKAKATDTQGRRVKLAVAPRTGEVIEDR